MRTHSLVVSNVTKTFGTLRANDGVTMHVRNGSVHAVLGENGAGKSTLMNILYGLYRPDSGQILVRDRPVVIDSPKTALRLGIGMVHQHFTLVGPLTVVENVVLGRAERWHSLDLAVHARRLLALSESFGFEIDPHQPIWRLPIGMQQRVEILKLLYHNADILIFDEPTSVLTPKEVGPFLDVLGRLRDFGQDDPLRHAQARGGAGRRRSRHGHAAGEDARRGRDGDDDPAPPRSTDGRP